MAVDHSGATVLGCGCAAGLVLGALACVQLPALPPLWLCAVAAVGGLCGWILRWRGRVPAAALFGLAWPALHGHWALQQQLAPGASAQDVVVRGRII
uniref:hypothetical protein n=1 Tax=Diaphorobacter nitroreducens TaxID=164759 RepID=UPI0028A6D006